MTTIIHSPAAQFLGANAVRLEEKVTLDDSRKTNSQALINLNASLEKATAKVSFWGARTVTIEGKEQSLSSYVKDLNFFFNKSLLVDGEKADLTLEGRVAGLSILGQIDRLTKEADDYAANTNLFTRVLALIGRVLFGKPQITFNVVNPFNEAITRLEEIRQRLDLSDEDYSKEQALADLAAYRPLLDHAVWEAAGSPISPVGGRFGGDTIDANPKDERVKKAIDLRVLKFSTVDRYNREGFVPNLPTACL